MDAKQLGVYVREKRTAKGLGVRQLARILKIDPAILCRFEKGQRVPLLPTLKVICAYFDLELEQIDLYKNVNFEPVRYVYQPRPKEERVIQCDRCLARKRIYV